MRRICLTLLWMAPTLWLSFPGALVAQQATVGTPLHSVSESFAERIGTQWGLNFRNGFVRFGGPGAAVPPFGNSDPNSALNFGFGFRGGDVNGSFNGSFGQSFQRSLVSQTPMITLTNGVPGYFGDASISPFVMGYVPVVGGYPVFPAFSPPTSSSGVGSDAVRQALQPVRSRSQSQGAVVPNLPSRDLRDDLSLAGGEPAPAATAPAKAPADVAIEKLAAARASSAGRPAPSVAEARRLRAAETEAADQEAQRCWQKGLEAEKEGSLASARIYYGMAAKRATGEFQRQILSRLEAMKTPPTK
jgi:hypothetical protein